MDTFLVEIEAAQRQAEYRREFALARQWGAPGPLPCERAPGGARRKAVALGGVVLVTFALLVGGAAATPGAGADDGTPANISVAI